MRPPAAFAAAVLAALLMAGCGPDRTAEAAERARAGDGAGAVALLEAQRTGHPDDLPVRYLLFVLYKHLALQAGPEQARAYQDKAIAEYDHIARLEGIAPDYRDMEASLRAKPEGAKRLAEARRPVHGDL